MPQPLGLTDRPITTAGAVSQADRRHVSPGTVSTGDCRGGSERKSELASVASGATSAGLVNTVTSHAWQHPRATPQDVETWATWATLEGFQGDPWAGFNRWFATQLRLSRMRRRTLTRSRLQVQEAEDLWPGHAVEFVTLTYRPGDEWSPKHIAMLMTRYRDQARRDGVPFRYEWVAELQLKRMRRRGESAKQCMHYHALLWHPSGYSYPHPDSRGWWRYGMSNVELARNPVGYLAKYASKGTEGEALPRGARISGGGGLSERGQLEASWWLRPRYVREAFPDMQQRVRRHPGGGWFNWDEGVFLDAPQFR
jgi:hypothetical protein